MMGEGTVNDEELVEVKGRIWLCVERRSDGTVMVHGDTGREGFADPYRPGNCQFGGWLNHLDDCGWFTIKADSGGSG